MLGEGVRNTDAIWYNDAMATTTTIARYRALYSIESGMEKHTHDRPRPAV